MFDHYSDAYNDYVLHGEDCEYFHGISHKSKYKYNFRYEKLYYYHIECETDKAYLIHFLCMMDAVWVPKCRCRNNNNKKENSILVLKNTRGVTITQTKSDISNWRKKGKKEDTECRGKTTKTKL